MELAVPDEMTPAPLDARLEALAAARFESVLRRNPVLATFMGRHAADDRLGDLSPEGVERDLAEVRTYIADLETLDPAGLSASARFERELALWTARKERFTSEELPPFFAEIEASGRGVGADDDPGLDRLRNAIGRANAALEDYRGWLREGLGSADDDFALGRERYDELVALRAFDGLTSEEILEIGEQQLAEQKAARVTVAREIDPHAGEAEVLDRVKNDHPATFEQALEEYRTAMLRARAHLVERDLVTIPDGEHLRVVPTPEYLRNVMPFAAYFEPPKFDREPTGVYIVTPSVNGDPAAMREHNRASISNTSIHEAYPGHHLQLSAAITHPSLVRALVDAPEFTEGWGM